MYQVAIIENNSWNPDGSLIIRHDCGHRHRTLSGAERCKHSLSKFWSDGTHNEWAGFGTILCDGKSLSANDRDELEQYEYRRYTHERR